MAENELQLRSYEVSIWTLQDSFITVLKAADTEHKGAIQNGTLEIIDDGTENLNFTVPKYYRVQGQLTLNPLWKYILDGHLVANMHKIKLIFNKATEDESVFEFLVTNVAETHEKDEMMYEVSCEGLAFHELGKIGYKIYLSDEDFAYENEEWFNEYHELFEENKIDDYAQLDPPDAPIMNIQYWNDKIFYYTDEEGNRQQKYQWDYILQMDWSDTSAAEQRSREKVYDDEYVASWALDWIDQQTLYPTRIEKFKEKSRSISVEESNIYNITQTIAEKFGVYCKYVYDYDDNYHIIGKHVVYYNNNFIDSAKHIDITYPYHTSSIKRNLDNSELTTKLFVQPISDSNSIDNLISITTAEPNKSKEDYILNFDYLHKIHTITDEQYEAVGQFEYDVAKYNYKLEWILDRISIYETKFNEALANTAFYENALELDKERLDDANSKLDALTNGDKLIERPEDNPVGLSVEFETEDKSVVSVAITLQGVIPSSIRLYQEIDHTAYGVKRLKTELRSGEFVLDDYGYVTSIKNIRLENLSEGEKITRIYMTCSYSPQNYYEGVVQAWETRIVDDTRKAKESYDEEVFYGAYLYGPDVDYARADWSKVEFAIAGTSIAMGENEPGYGIANGTYVDDAIVEDAHGLYCMYDIYSLRKEILVTKFERMMGPALREGYWTPKDYQDYGNQYSDYFPIIFQEESLPSAMGNSIIDYSWDRINQFTGETKLTYEIGVQQKIEHYYVLNLEPYMDIVANNIKDLCIFYADTDAIEAYEQLINYPNDKIRLEGEVSALQDRLNALAEDSEERTQIETSIADKNKTIAWIASKLDYISDECETLLTRAERWITPSEYTYAYIIDEDDEKENGFKVIPALIITTSGDFSNQTWLGLSGILRETELDGGGIQLDRLDSQYKPYLGVITTNQTLDENGKVIDTQINHVRLTPALDESCILVGKPDGSTYNNPDFVRKLSIVQPRIAIDSLYVKPTSVLLALNNNNLSSPEDYSIFTDVDQITDEDKYYITIKPTVFMSVMGNKTVYINYNISNAAEEIYLDALKVSKENATPKVSYEVALSVFNKNSMREVQDYLRRVVYINDTDMQFDNVAGYISKLTLDLDHPWQDTAEIKNYETKFEDLFSTIVAQTESMKKNESTFNMATAAFTSSGLLRNDIIKESILKADLNYAFNQGTLTIDEKQGIWGTSDEGVIAIRGGGIFTATEKDAAGNWKWNTGILPTGINADLITSGQLDTNRIRIYAGDKVAFQMNGEGIFAYKTLRSTEQLNLPRAQEGDNEETHNYENYLKDQKDGIDSLQYVTYNDNGLFLVAKVGAKILKNADGSDVSNSDYFTINQEDIVDNATEVHRVEVSWEGLILRNWINERTFWADPDTGDLHLKGNIETEQGRIGAWTITAAGLQGTNLDIVNDPKDTNKNGIFLGNNTAQSIESVIYMDEIYYGYHIQGEDKTYYLALSDKPISYTIGTSSSDPKIVTYREDPITAAPLRTETVTVQEPSSSEPNAPLIDVKYTYIKDENNDYIKDTNDENIVYDGSDSLQSSWYLALLDVHAIDGNVEYLTYITTNNLIEVTLDDGTYLVSNAYQPTFEVHAQDGRVVINNGNLGPFTLTSTKLLGGTSNDENAQNGIIEFVKLQNSTIESWPTSLYGRMIKDISGNSSNGTIHFERVDGTSGNFNIADMQYFKSSVSAAENKGFSTGYTAGRNSMSGEYNRGWNACLRACGIEGGGTVYTGSMVGPVWLSPTSGPPSYSTVIANYTSHSVSSR